MTHAIIMKQKHVQATIALPASRILHYDVTMKMSLSTYCSENAYYVHGHSIMY